MNLKVELLPIFGYTPVRSIYFFNSIFPMTQLVKSNGRTIGTCLAFMTAMMLSTSFAQNPSTATADKAVTPSLSQPLNLDSSSIAAEINKEEPAEKTNEVLSASPNKIDDLFKKAERHGVLPTNVEITTPGAPQRVTKVTGADGSYCVYSPAVGKTDGIDEIQNGLQTQVRSCPSEATHN
jgi:hypothetical protein